MKLKEIIEFKDLLSNLSVASLNTTSSIKTYKLLGKLKEFIKTIEEGRKTFFLEKGVEKDINGNWKIGELEEKNKDAYNQIVEKIEAETNDDLHEDLIKDLIPHLNYLSYNEFAELVKDRKISVIINTKEGTQEKVEKDIIYNSAQSYLLYEFLVKKDEN